jgi:hypothetical protein
MIENNCRPKRPTRFEYFTLNSYNVEWLDAMHSSVTSGNVSVARRRRSSERDGLFALTDFERSGNIPTADHWRANEPLMREIGSCHRYLGGSKRRIRQEGGAPTERRLKPTESDQTPLSTLRGSRP